MKRLISAFLALSLSLPGIPPPVWSASTGVIMGTVADTRGNPISGVRIVARDPAAKVLGEAFTDSSGCYALQNLPQGHLQLALNPERPPFLGNNVVAYLGELGLTVNWTVSERVPAIALASIGTASASSTNAAIAGLAFMAWSGSMLWSFGRRYDGDRAASGSN
jgi:hypothetical protein